MHSKDAQLDTELLQQYVEILGVEGISASFSTFEKMCPEYLNELKSVVATENETAIRQCAHKMKGSCRSLGFIRLGQSMEVIEKGQWSLEQLQTRIDAWENMLQADVKAARAWLDQQT
ncbi:Hpt domain-containing protein [Aliidiomarina indica]|uniref:Hpt domain-containing protein n=1 Tax=Aliidiomarina indica TaxID=2749147 RepID=UPI00188E7B0D|nr:Hpt domain-containing protein [Aliidiomarina indica]